MKLFLWEYRKLFRQKSLIVIFVICALTNLIFINVSEKGDAGSYTPAMYMALQQDITKLPPEDAYHAWKSCSNGRKSAFPKQQE